MTKPICQTARGYNPKYSNYLNSIIFWNCRPLTSGYLLGLLFHPEYGDGRLLRNIGGLLPNYRALKSRRSLIAISQATEIKVTVYFIIIYSTTLLVSQNTYITAC
jgi:hypothetical protein